MSVDTAVKMPQVDRAAASRAAVAMRRDRAVLKEDLRCGRISHQQILVSAMNKENPAAQSLRVTEFLLTLPFVGEAKLARILDELGISPRKRLAGLGRHQAKHLWDFLGEWLVKHPIRKWNELDS